MRAADDDTPSLPDDPAALRALLLGMQAQVDTLVAERDALASQNERLQHLLLKLTLDASSCGGRGFSAAC